MVELFFIFLTAVFFALLVLSVGAFTEFSMPWAWTTVGAFTIMSLLYGVYGDGVCSAISAG